MMSVALPYILSVCCLWWAADAGPSRPSYTSAVFEHARFGSENDSAALVVETNLDYYRRAAKVARAKHADLILFPEYGIFPPGSRSDLKKFLEYIPDPDKERVNPCEDRDKYKDRPILRTLSCMAKFNSLVVVANTGDIQNCTGDYQCPSDGVYHYNTNVVFNRDGTLLVKYHKEHLYFEFGMNLPKKQQNSTFKTDFGTFATYICFDINFPRMGEVGRWPGVDAILFSTMWFEVFPQYMSVQYWQSWALGNNVTLLAANIQNPHYYSVGSGMFHGQNGAIAYTYDPNGISKLVVANVPRAGFPPVPSNASFTAISPDSEWETKNTDENVPYDCSESIVGDSGDSYRCIEARLENYTFVKLTEPKGHVEACNGGMCCSVDYATNGFATDGDYTTEGFYLGVFNGSFNAMDRYFSCEEDCVLSRCDFKEDIACGVFPTRSETVFSCVYLRANFTSEIVAPQVLESGMRLVPKNEWHRHSVDYHSDHNPTSERWSVRSVHFENKAGRPLISVGMRGRCYDRDPPYRQ